MSKEEKRRSTKRRSGRTKKHHTVLPYITTPLIFVVISMVVVAPILAGGLNFAVDTVHEAQQVLSIGNNDRVAGDKVASIRCRRIGLNADVYSGINRVSLRNGCGMTDDENGIRIAGYSSSVFKPLLNTKMDDVFTITIGDEETMYRVVDVSNELKDANDDCIVLCTTKDNAPFSYYDSERLFVTAKEVRYE